MRKAILISFAVLLSVALFSGEWEKAADAAFLANLNNYSDNWAGDEASSFNWTLTGNGTFKKAVTEYISSENVVKLGFGQSTGRMKNDTAWSELLKSTDIIDIDNVERLTLKWLVDPFIGVHFESSFLDQSDSMKTCYVNPVKLTESFGIARTLVKNERIDWSMRIGAALRQFADRNATDSLGEKVTEISNDGGLELVTDASAPISANATYTGKLTLYKAFFYSGADALIGTPQENLWKAPDASFDNILAVKAGSYLTVNINLQLLYDKEIDSGMRLKESVALGLTYKLL